MKAVSTRGGPAAVLDATPVDQPVAAPELATPQNNRSTAERISWGVFGAAIAVASVECGVDFVNDWMSLRQGRDVVLDGYGLSAALIGPYWSWCCATRTGLVSAVVGRCRKVAGAPLDGD